MLLCGVATTCVEALNYGISLFYLIGHLIIFPLCFCIGGIAAWKIAKSNGLWQLARYTLLFSTLTYCLYHIILYPIYGVSFSSSTYWSAVCYYVLFSILPVILCCYGYKRIERMNKTYPSPIKTISVEKITIPFTFDKTYCRIGVVTDNNGIERMEAYFVRNDKTAICYRNSSFQQVVIDDAKHDKYDNCELNTGTIISIRATTGLANYIVKLSDNRLIVFEVLPKAYGGLYENFTIITPNDDKYSDYLEDYIQGKEIDFEKQIDYETDR